VRCVITWSEPPVTRANIHLGGTGVDGSASAPLGSRPGDPAKPWAAAPCVAGNGAALSRESVVTGAQQSGAYPQGLLG